MLEVRFSREGAFFIVATPPPPKKKLSGDVATVHVPTKLSGNIAIVKLRGVVLGLFYY